MEKRTRRIIISIVIWLLMVAGAAAYLFYREEKSEKNTVWQDAAENEDAFYVADNTTKAGILRQMTKQGEVTGLFTTEKLLYLNGWKMEQVDTVEENPYAVFSRVRDDDGRIITEYVCAIFNESLEVTYITPPFRLPLELNLTGFSAEEDSLYLTALSDNRMEAYVYIVEPSDMMRIEDTALSRSDVAEWEQRSIDVYEYRMDNCSALRYFAEAEYRDGELYQRFDDSREGYFAADETLVALYRDRNENYKQKVSASTVSIPAILVVAILGILLIILMSIVLHARLRVTYAVMIYEVLLLVLLSGISWYLVKLHRDTAKAEYERYASGSIEGVFDGYSYVSLEDEDFYYTDAYQILQERLVRLAERAGENTEALDLLIVNRNDQDIRMSISGKNNGSIVTLYGEEAWNAALSAASSSSHVLVTDTLRGTPVLILAVSLRDAGYPDYVAVELMEQDALFDGIWKENGLLFRFMLTVFLIGSVVGIILFFLESRDIARLQTALTRLSNGDGEIQKPSVIGRDMNYMWNSLFEIQKNILRTNRIKFLTYEAYYRFAPKSVERILQKQSITEVQTGDMVRMMGTIAVISASSQMTDHHEIDRMNQMLIDMETCRKEHDGIFISHNNDFSAMELLFLEKSYESITFGIEFLLKLREKKEAVRNVTLLMHYTPFVYGVAGTEEQASVYLASKELSYLQQYVDWFRSMRLGLVVTEELLEHENVELDYRYIGFVIPEGGSEEHRIRLYEILDAESTRVHNMRLRQGERFAAALDSFYKQDFYLARSAFTDIVREAPDDALAKWYLFECEHYLNEAAPEHFVGALHMTD